MGGPPRKLTILTYNVWFDNFYKHERYLVIMRILEQSDADFICLQEVTEDFKALLMAEDWAKKKYFVSGSSMFTFYGVLIMSKWPCKFYEREFVYSRMGRSILLCEALINDKPFIVSTVHLESLDNAKVRRDQLL